MGFNIRRINATLGNVEELVISGLRAFKSGTSGSVPVVTVDDGSGGAVVINVTGRVGTTNPLCVVRHSVNQSIPNATDTALAFDTDVVDSEAMHDPATNNSRITIVTAGKYLITWNINFASNATGFRALTFRKNGTTNIGRIIVPPVNGERTETSGALHATLAAGDYVEVLAHQNSGGALNCEAVNSVLPQLAAYWLAA